MNKIKGDYIDVACPVCEGTEFENVDYFKQRTSDQKLCICNKCGHIIYNPQPTNESLIEYYKSNYRSKVEIGNIITCNRKLNYHKRFLGKLIDKPGRMVDVGCANGYLPAYFKSKGWEAMGTEHTHGFVNYAKGEFGLDIRGDLSEFDGQFDLISYYHVLEHIQNPHIELGKARERLKDNGYIYISIPIFEELDIAAEAGHNLTALDNILPLEHINFFSKVHIQSLLNKVGFEIINYNEFYYGWTILAKKCEPKIEVKGYNPNDTKRKLLTMQTAITLSTKGDYEGAVETFPLFPSAWLNLAMTHKKFKDAIAVLFSALKIMPLHSEIAATIGHTYYRNSMFHEAIGAYRWGFELKPGSEQVCKQLGLCYCEAGEIEEGIKWFKIGMEINPTEITEFQKWIGWAYNKMK